MLTMPMMPVTVPAMSKPTRKQDVRVTVPLPDDIIGKADDFRFDRRFRSQGAAIAELVRLGLIKAGYLPELPADD